MAMTKLLTIIVFVILSATKCHDEHGHGSRTQVRDSGPIYMEPCGKKGKECIEGTIPIPSTIWLFVTALVILKLTQKTARSIRDNATDF